MCKHVLNAQVAVRAPCCRRFFDCAQCHEEAMGGDHKLRKTLEIQFVCKQCRRAFRKDVSRMEAQDEYCPHCDNHFVIEAKTSATPEKEVRTGLGGDATADEEESIDRTNPRLAHSMRALLDDRMRYDPRNDWLDQELSANEQGNRIDEGGLLGVLQQRQDDDRQAAQSAQQMSKIMQQHQQQMQTQAHAFNDDDLDWS